MVSSDYYLPFDHNSIFGYEVIQTQKCLNGYSFKSFKSLCEETGIHKARMKKVLRKLDTIGVLVTCNNEYRLKPPNKG